MLLAKLRLWCQRFESHSLCFLNHSLDCMHFPNSCVHDWVRQQSTNRCDQNSIFTYQQPIIIYQKYFFKITDLSLLICYTVSLVNRIPGLLDHEEESTQVLRNVGNYLTQRHSLTTRKTWIFINRTSNIAFFRSLFQSNACRNYVNSSLPSVNTSWMQARMRSHRLVVSSCHGGHCNWMSLSARSVIAVKQIEVTVVRL